MQYFSTWILSSWGAKPRSRSFHPISKAVPYLNLDNTAIESSFNITSTKPDPTVRLSVEINRVSAQNALDEDLRRNQRIDNTLDTSWKESLHGSVLSNTAGFFGDMGVGFDIRPRALWWPS